MLAWSRISTHVHEIISRTRDSYVNSHVIITCRHVNNWLFRTGRKRRNVRIDRDNNQFLVPFLIN